MLDRLSLSVCLHVTYYCRLESGFDECCDQTSKQAHKQGDRKDVSVTKDLNVQEKDREEKHPSKH